MIYKRELCCLTSFLLGLNANYFDAHYAEEFPEAWSTYSENEKLRNIRELSVVRNTILSKFSSILSALQISCKNVVDMDMFDKVSIAYLRSKGYPMYYPSKDLYKILDSLRNDIMSEFGSFIYEDKEIFPDWLDKKLYVQLFTMKSDTRSQSKRYRASKSSYPFQLWVNGDFRKIKHNILADDGALCRFIYKDNDAEYGTISKFLVVQEDNFSRLGVICGANKDSDCISLDAIDFEENNSKEILDNFIDEKRPAIFVVDCENTDINTVYTVVESSNSAGISKIILVDDVNSKDDWQSLSDFIDVPVEYIQTKRLLAHKSVVDLQLALRVQQEVIQNSVRGVVLFSSDSDYLCLIENLTSLGAETLIVVDPSRASKLYYEALDENNIPYVCASDFSYIDLNGKKISMYEEKVVTYLNTHYHFNLNEVIGINFDALAKDDELSEKVLIDLQKKLKVRVKSSGEIIFSLDN